MDDAFAIRLKFFVACVLAALVGMQLWEMLSIDIWRQDSLHYVTSYADKLSAEGRWINYFLFDVLRAIPPSLSILVSYFCLGYFAYALSHRVVGDAIYSLCFALLVLNIPVLSVQLEWPDTLTVGFMLLVVAVFASRKLPDYIFFPLFSCLFFGTFSVFYFLLPLLFAEKITTKSFFRLLLIWGAAFVFGYGVTNFIVHLLTGEMIQVAGWRQPHPVQGFGDLMENVVRVSKEFGSHVKRYIQIIGWFSLSAALVFALVVRQSKQNIWCLVLGLVCALAVYYSTVTLGIVVQARSSLTFVVGIFFVMLVIKGMSPLTNSIGVVLMLAIGLNMGLATYTTVSAYARLVANLLGEIKQAMPYSPQAVNQVYIVVDSAETRAAFKKMERKISYKSYFSEDFKAPMSWLSSFRLLGYQNVAYCIDGAGLACDEPLKYMASLEPVVQQSGLFRSYAFGKDVIITINK